MKTILAILLLSLAPTLAAAQHSVTFTYNLPDIGTVQVCSGTVTADCLVGANIYLVAGAGLTKLNLLPVAIPPGATSGTLMSFTSAPWTHLGNSTASATTVYKDASGVQGESAQSAPVTFQVKPFVPGNLVATPQ